MNKISTSTLVTATLILITACDGDTIISDNGKQSDFRTVPPFSSAIVTDYNNQKAENKGGGLYTFKMSPDSITYPVSISQIKEVDTDKHLGINYVVNEGLIASSITTFLSYFDNHNRNNALKKLSNITNIPSERLLSDFYVNNDLETAKVARLIYYIIDLDMTGSFIEYFDNNNSFSSSSKDSLSSTNGGFNSFVSGFINDTTIKFQSENNPHMYFLAKKIEYVNETIYSKKSFTDIKSFYNNLNHLRKMEFDGVLGSAGSDLFSAVVSNNLGMKYNEAFELINGYIEIVYHSGSYDYSIDQIKKLGLSPKNIAFLDGNDALIYSKLFNSLLKESAKNNSDKFYSPDQIMTVVGNLRSMLVDKILYNKNELIMDLSNLFGISISSSGLDAVRYELDADLVNAVSWELDDYIDFFNRFNHNELEPAFTETLTLINGGQLKEFNPVLGTGTKAGDVVAKISAKALDNKTLTNQHWNIVLSGSDASAFDIIWNISDKTYDIVTNNNLTYIANSVLNLEYISRWTRYDSIVQQEGNAQIFVNEDKEFFSMIDASYSPNNPSIEGHVGDHLRVRFSKSVDAKSLSVDNFELSNSSASITSVYVSDNSENEVILLLDSSDITVSVLQRDKDSIFSYGSGSNNLLVGSSFDTTLYDENDVTKITVKSGIRGKNSDGTFVPVDASIDIDVGKLYYRGINYELTRSPNTGRIFFAQNLGAIDKCDNNSTNPYDVLPTCRGHYYQANRTNDGHQIFNNPLLPNSDAINMGQSDYSVDGFSPETSSFIITNGENWTNASSGFFESSSPLRSITSGIYCPVGYRVPSLQEYETEFRYIDSLINSAQKTLDNFAQSYMYLGHTGNRRHDGAFGDDDLFLTIYWSERSGYGLSSRGGVISGDMTSYDGASYRHFDKQRLRRGFTMRCMKDY